MTDVERKPTQLAWIGGAVDPGAHAVCGLDLDRLRAEGKPLPDAPKADELARRPEVCVTLSRSGAYRYVSISGDAELVDDRAKLEELWHASDNQWFDGPDDPRAVLLKVTPHHGQIWEGVSGPAAVAEFWFSAASGVDPDALRRAEKAEL